MFLAMHLMTSEYKCDITDSKRLNNTNSQQCLMLTLYSACGHFRHCLGFKQISMRTRNRLHVYHINKVLPVNHSAFCFHMLYTLVLLPINKDRRRKCWYIKSILDNLIYISRTYSRQQIINAYHDLKQFKPVTKHYRAPVKDNA